MKIMYEVRTLLFHKEPLLKNFSKVAQWPKRIDAENRVKKDINEGYRSQIFERELSDEKV